MIDPDDLREASQIEGVLLPEYQHEVLGHGPVAAKLMAMLSGARLPSAVLLHGPRGIGKATLAFDFARRVFCQTGDEDEARVQEQVASGAHPNLNVLRPVLKPDGKGFRTEIVVGDIRQKEARDPTGLREKLHMTRGRDGARVCIVDSIDDCNSSAANSLLKLLEEPPSETIFLLVSHRPGSLLPTIRSRCQAFAMRPVQGEHVASLASRFFADADSEQIRRAVGFAAGRPRKALEYLALEDSVILENLTIWLGGKQEDSQALLHLADALAGAEEVVSGFAKEMVMHYFAETARQQAIAGDAVPGRLASASALWDKARSLFLEADTYNLDPRQTWVSLFDAMRDDARAHAPANQ